MRDTASQPAAQPLRQPTAGILIGIPAVALLFGLGLLTASPDRALAAESGFAFLRAPVSARGAAMGGTGVSYLDGAAAAFLNPAAVASRGGGAQSDSPWGLVGDVSLTHYESLADLRDTLPVMVNTPEIRVECPDDIKFDVVRRATETLRARPDVHSVIDVDGVRANFGDGWGLVRASNTQPALVVRCEARTQARLGVIRAIIEGAIAAAKSAR